MNDSARQKHGLLLIGHGSRDPAGADEFLALARRTADSTPELAVEASFLEFNQPTIAAGFRALVERGVERVVATPVMLFSAGHIQRDIPDALRVLIAEYPRITVSLCGQLGCHGRLLALSARRLREALHGLPEVPAAETELVMVGRGSQDAEATAEMLRYVRLHSADRGLANAHAAFVAMAEPNLEAVLQAVAVRGPRRVVVQPHLLFSGVLLERIGKIVTRYADAHPGTEWVLTHHLGPEPELALALVDSAAGQIV